MSPNVNDLKSSKFLTKNDVGTGVEVTIKSYEKINVAMESQKAEDKWVLYFHEFDKPLVLNSTNGQLIAAITGEEDFDKWLEKKVVLYNDPTVGFAGKITGGIRVRAVSGRHTESFDEFVANNPVEQEPVKENYDEPGPTEDDIPT